MRTDVDGGLQDLLTACVQEVQDQFDVPGIAVVAFDEQGVLGSVASGRRSIEDTAPMTMNTRFRLHSMTKLLTAVMVLRLSDQGMLTLDSKLADLCPRLVSAAPNLLASLTVEQILSHTAGLPDGPTEIAGDSRDLSGLRSDTVALASGLSPVAAPGHVYSYSNYAYSVLGAAVEELVGAPYSEVMTRTVAGPLGLSSLCFDPVVAMTHPLSQQHLVRRGHLVVDHWYGESVRMYPAAMAFLDPMDLAQLGRMYLCSGHVPGSTERFLTREGVAAQCRRRVDIGLVDDRHYGLGAYVGPRVGEADCFGHEGFFTGMWCNLVIYPGQRCGIAWCDNRGDDPVISNGRRTAITRVAGMLGVPEHCSERDRSAARPDEDTLVGTYVRNGARPLKVRHDGAGLSLTLGNATFPLAHHAKSIYRLDDVPSVARARAPLAPHSGSRTPSVAFHSRGTSASHLSLNGILYGRGS